MASASEMPSKLEMKVTEQLNCPICLENYKSPRVLGCLHSFCEKCISSYIVKAVEKGSLKSAIPCPLCKTAIVPPNSSTPPSEWALDLPINCAIVNMLGSTESESGIDCENCRGQDKTTPAKSYCKDCKMYQCEDCVKIHTILLSVKGHQIVKLIDLPKQQKEQLNLGRVQYCQQHSDREVELFCEDHKALCCFECQFLHHRSCKEVTDVKKLGQRLKEGGKPQQLEDKMETLQTKLEEIAEKLETNMDNIEKEAQSIPKKMTEARNKVVKMFDQLVTTVTSDCGQLKKQHKTEIEDKITGIRSLEAANNTSRGLLQEFLKNGTETQLFIAISKLEEQVSRYYKQVNDAQHTMNTVEIQLILDDDLEKLIQSTGTLAKVSVQKLQMKLKFLQFPISDCVIEKSPLIAIQKRAQYRPCYRGAFHLPDGQLVATDSGRSLFCLLDDSFNVIKDVGLSSSPTDLAVIGPTEVAIVLQNVKQLQRVTVDNKLTLTGKIPCQRTPVSVSPVSETELAVGWETGIGIITLDGEVKMTIDRDKSGREIKFSYHDRILADVRKSRFYHSSRNANTVYCLGFNGEVHFTYSNGLNCPCGMCLDREGNLYICSNNTGSVPQVNPEGELIQIIDTGMNNPFTVSFNPTNDELTVMGYSPRSFLCNGLKIKFVPPPPE